MQRKFNLGDVVIPKFKPNYGEMSVHKNLGKMFGGSDINPMYACKYFDTDKKHYILENFLESDLQLTK